MNIEDSYVCIENNTKAPAKYILLQPMDDRELELAKDIVALIKEKTEEPFIFIAVRIKDWNRELPPWNGPAVFGSDDFYGGGELTLRFVTENIITNIKSNYSLSSDCKVILGGYSLAGLFSLYGGHESNAFDGIVAASPSVWFQGFLEYVNSHSINAKAVYLSLGDREEKTRNPVMATVGDCIRSLNEIYEESDYPIYSILEWNKGNHFLDFEKRIAKGYVWCIEALNK